MAIFAQQVFDLGMCQPRKFIEWRIHPNYIRTR